MEQFQIFFHGFKTLKSNYKAIFGFLGHTKFIFIKKCNFLKCVNISQDLEMKKLGFGSLFSRVNFTVIFMKLSFLVEGIANHSHKR